MLYGSELGYFFELDFDSVSYVEKAVQLPVSSTRETALFDCAFDEIDDNPNRVFAFRVTVAGVHFTESVPFDLNVSNTLLFFIALVLDYFQICRWDDCSSCVLAVSERFFSEFLPCGEDVVLKKRGEEVQEGMGRRSILG